jgi:apolipoprotein D and lipocalin family protein
MKHTAFFLCAATCLAMPAPAAAQDAPPLTPLPQLHVPSYMGTWYQVAWFPNRFQKQCVSDTAATYQQLPGGQVQVVNRCKTADGRFDSVTGVARPANARINGELLSPATLEVSFLPAALRWLPIWGDYWVIQLADNGRYAVVSDSQRAYLWVLSRTPSLAAADQSAIRSALVQQGFDLARWQDHPHTGGTAPPEPAR